MQRRSVGGELLRWHSAAGDLENRVPECPVGVDGDPDSLRNKNLDRPESTGDIEGGVVGCETCGHKIYGYVAPMGSDFLIGGHGPVVEPTVGEGCLHSAVGQVLASDHLVGEICDFFRGAAWAPTGG